jgi:hypothetical protein
MMKRVLMVVLVAGALVLTTGYAALDGGSTDGSGHTQSVPSDRPIKKDDSLAGDLNGGAVGATVAPEQEPVLAGGLNGGVVGSAADFHQDTAEAGGLSGGVVGSVVELRRDTVLAGGLNGGVVGSAFER